MRIESNLTVEWLTKDYFDLVVVNIESLNHWGIFEDSSFKEEWCVEMDVEFRSSMPYHDSGSFRAYARCVG